MDLINENNIFFLISAVLFFGLITKINIMPSFRHIYKGGHFNMTVYGLVAGIAIFLTLNHLNKCKTNLIQLILVIVLFLFIMYNQCSQCHGEYHFVTVYQYLIPLLPLFFDCNQIQVIITSIAIGSAIGRLGCISAGCCNGPIVPKGAAFSMKYSDPEQLINKKLETKECYAKPTVILEAIIQFIIAGLCINYPQHASLIFSLSSVFLVKLTDTWREDDRNKAYLAYPSLIFIALYCLSKGPIKPIVCNKRPNYLVNATIGLIIMWIYSNDVNLNSLMI